MKTHASPDDVLDITGSPMVPRLLVIGGCIFLVLGAGIAWGRDISMGLCICVAALIAAVVGAIWWRRLPVKLRLTRKGLHFLTGDQQSVRWLDIERVIVPKIAIRGVSFVCIRVTADHPLRGPQTGESVTKLLSRLFYDFDIVLRDDQYAPSADGLLHEFNRRISWANARGRAPGAEAATPLQCRESGPVRIESATAMAIPEELGVREATYPPGHKGARRSILAGLAIAAFGVAVIVTYHVRPPLPGEETGMFLLLYGIGGASILVGLVCVLMPFFKQWQTFSVYQHGFLVQEKTASHVCYWRDVAVVQARAVTGILLRRQVDEVVFGNGQKLQIDALRTHNAHDLTARIGRAVGDHLAPQVLERLNENRLVPFGPLVLMRAGVQAGRTFLPWTEIGYVRAERSTGTVIVESASRVVRTGFHVVEVPNLPVIAAVVKLVNEHLTQTSR
jgi:hypothetical protein